MTVSCAQEYGKVIARNISVKPRFWASGITTTLYIVLGIGTYGLRFHKDH